MSGAIPQHVLSRIRHASTLKRPFGGRRKVPRRRYPHAIEVDYAKQIIGIVDRARKAFEPLLAELPALVARSRSERGLRTDYGEAQRVRQLLDQAKRQIDQSTQPYALEQMITRYGRATSEYQRGEIARQLKAAFGVDIQTIDTKGPSLLDHFTTTNALAIASLGARLYDDISRRAIRSLDAPDALSQVADRFAVYERDARGIARNQIGSLVGSLDRSRQQDLGVKEFIWATKRDDLVRPSHRRLEGGRYTWDDLPTNEKGVRIAPGDDYGCRCGSIPVFDEIRLKAAA